MDTNVVGLLKKVGGIITDSHIVYTSGKHGSVYLNKDAIYPHATETAKVGKMFAEKFKDLDIDVVVAPAIGGTLLSQWTAFYLSEIKGKEVLGVYTEKDKGTLAGAAESAQIFRRGYDKFVKGKKVLVLEDLVTTGMLVKKTVETVRKTGGEVLAVGVMFNRVPDKINSDFIGAPFYALANFPAQAFDEAVCPLCKKGVPINTLVGYGKQYLQKKGLDRKS